MYGKKELYIAIFFYTKGGSLMNSTFASSYELLLSAISELELQKDSFVLHPGVDFSRKRKISFSGYDPLSFNHAGWLSFYYIP